MKRFLSGLLVLVLALSMLPVVPLTAQAATEYTGGYYTYTVTNEKATITDCDTAINGDITIPATLGGYPVTAIGVSAFYNCRELTSVTVPDSVTSIGAFAFNLCYQLTGIWVAEGNPNYSSDDSGVLFNKDKTALMQVPQGISGSYTIPDSVITTSASAFNNCNQLTGIWVSEGNPNYASDDFGVLFNKDMTMLIKAPCALPRNEYAIPTSVTAIGQNAFSICRNLTSINIPGGVARISQNAFSGCINLTSINIPASVTTIGIPTFVGCYDLTGIWVDANNPNYTNDDFGVLFNKDMTTLVQAPRGISGSYTVPDGVATIGEYSFTTCTGLASVKIPDSVTVIERNVFVGCSNLASVTIPDSVQTIGVSAFHSCDDLTDVYYDGTRQQWDTIFVGSGNECLMDATFHGVVNYVSNNDATCLTDGTKTAKCDCCDKTYTKADVDSKLGHSFTNYISNNDATYDSDGTKTAKCDRCEETSTVTDEGTKLIRTGWWDIDGNRYYFSESGEKTVGLVGIDEELYYFDADGVMQTGIVTVGGKDYNFSEDGSAFRAWGGTTANGIQYIVDGDEVLITGCDTTISGDVTIPAILHGYPVVSLEDEAFYDCNAMTSVTIPAGVRSIGYHVFTDCAQLTAIWVDENSLNYSSDSRGVLFNKDKTELLQAPRKLSGSYTIPDTVETVGYFAFANCSALTDVTIPDGVTTIDIYAFALCDGLRELRLPASVTEFMDMGMERYNGAVWVDENNPNYSNDAYGVLFNKDKTELIKAHAGLTGSYQVPDSVVYIRTGADHTAFSGCPNLTAIVVDESNPNYSTDDRGVLFDKDKTELLQAPGGIVGDYYVPDTVYYINVFAFAECGNLTGIYADGLEQYSSDDRGVLYTLGGAGLINLPGGFTGGYTVPEGVEFFGMFAFAGCDKLTCLNLPSTASLGEDSIEMFDLKDCDSLEAVYVHSQEMADVLKYFAPSVSVYVVDHTHSFVSYVSDGNATVQHDGTKTAKCVYCDAIDTWPDPGSKLPATGWQMENGKWYYYQNGAKKTGWLNLGGAWYYMNAQGVMQTGWQQVGNAWYYFKSGGAMATGWLQVGGTWYYFKSSGAMATGWLQVGGTWYYFKSSGAMATGWLQVGNTWNYFKSSGAMATGWLQVGNTWYYFKSSGAMATGWLQVGNTWYYFSSSGAMKTGWLNLGGVWYYFHGSGAMATGSVKIGAKTYQFNTGGVCLNP